MRKVQNEIMHIIPSVTPLACACIMHNNAVKRDASVMIGLHAQRGVLWGLFDNRPMTIASLMKGKSVLRWFSCWFLLLAPCG